jgi:hypothetical protein
MIVAANETIFFQGTLMNINDSLVVASIKQQLHSMMFSFLVRLSLALTLVFENMDFEIFSCRYLLNFKTMAVSTALPGSRTERSNP